MATDKMSRPPVVSVLAILLLLFGLLAFLGSLFLWGGGFLLNPPPGTDLTFPIPDILVNGPASVIAAVGLWRTTRWGYAASQFVAGFYTYASVEIFSMVAQEGPPYPMEIIVPQVLALAVAAALVLYMRYIRDLFR